MMCTDQCIYFQYGNLLFLKKKNEADSSYLFSQIRFRKLWPVPLLSSCNTRGDYFLIPGIIVHCWAVNVRELTGHILLDPILWKREGYLLWNSRRKKMTNRWKLQWWSYELKKRKNFLAINPTVNVVELKIESNRFSCKQI